MAASLLADRDSTYPLRLLTHAVKELTDNAEIVDPTEVEIAPPPLPDVRWDTLMRASYAHALSGTKRPAWTSTTKLAEPWFVSDFPALRERAVTTTPDHQRRLNIFIDARSIERA
jgi:hypothetical protein